MIDSSFELNLHKHEKGRKNQLDTVLLSEVPEHTGISQIAKREIAEKIVRLEKLKKGKTVARIDNEKNVLKAGIQNVAVRELLAQKDGPASLSSEDFKNFLQKFNADFAEEYFGDNKWSGIASTARAIELDLRHNEDLGDKQVIFCDALDANDATDYIMAGRDTSEESSTYILELVQVGTLSGDKSARDIRDKFRSLVRRLHNEVSPESVFERNRKEIIDLLQEVAEGLESEYVSMRSLVEFLASKHLDVSEFNTSFEHINVDSDFSPENRQLFVDDFEKLVFLAQQKFSDEDLDNLVAEITEGDERSKITKVASDLLSLVFNQFGPKTLVKPTHFEIKGLLMTRFNDFSSREEIPLDIDKKLTAMYSINELELLTLLENIDHESSEQAA